MEQKPIYFDRESPDFNVGLWGKPERLAANRVIICIMTEFGLCNNARMQAHQVNSLIESLQATTGTFKAPKTRVKLKSKYIRLKHTTKPIRLLTTDIMSDYPQCSSVEITSQ
jgi:hypothetical protein